MKIRTFLLAATALLGASSAQAQSITFSPFATGSVSTNPPAAVASITAPLVDNSAYLNV